MDFPNKCNRRGNAPIIIAVALSVISFAVGGVMAYTVQLADKRANAERASKPLKQADFVAIVSSAKLIQSNVLTFDSAKNAWNTSAVSNSADKSWMLVSAKQVVATPTGLNGVIIGATSPTPTSPPSDGLSPAGNLQFDPSIQYDENGNPRGGIVQISPTPTPSPTSPGHSPSVSPSPTPSANSVVGIVDQALASILNGQAPPQVVSIDQVPAIGYRTCDPNHVGENIFESGGTIPRLSSCQPITSAVKLTAKASDGKTRLTVSSETIVKEATGTRTVANVVKARVAEIVNPSCVLASNVAQVQRNGDVVLTISSTAANTTGWTSDIEGVPTPLGTSRTINVTGMLVNGANTVRTFTGRVTNPAYGLAATCKVEVTIIAQNPNAVRGVTIQAAYDGNIQVFTNFKTGQVNVRNCNSAPGGCLTSGEARLGQVFYWYDILIEYMDGHSEHKGAIGGNPTIYWGCNSNVMWGWQSMVGCQIRDDFTFQLPGDWSENVNGEMTMSCEPTMSNRRDSGGQAAVGLSPYWMDRLRGWNGNNDFVGVEVDDSSHAWSGPYKLITYINLSKDNVTYYPPLPARTWRTSGCNMQF